MSRRDEIIQRANNAFNRVVEQCNSTLDEIRRQQQTALSTIPEARTAFETYQRRIDAAASARIQREQDLAQVRASAEEKAQRDQFDAQTAALTKWRTSTDAAEQTRADAVRDANRAYDAAFTAAMHLVLNHRDAAISRTRNVRDDAITAAQQAFERDKAKASTANESETAAAQDSAIKAISDARAIELEGQAQATVERERAQSAAGQALTSALAGIPLAAAIQEAFAGRLKNAEAKCEADKSDVLSRMRQELNSPETT